MNFFETLSLMLAQEREYEKIWDWLQQSEAGGFLTRMQKILQNPEFHGEGSVYTHTKMVCEALVRKEEFGCFSLKERTELFLAAFLHDVGKLRTTIFEDGRWVSPFHSAVGSRMARTFLWQTCGLCGSAEAVQIRETICGLVRYHMLPAHMIEEEDAAFRIRRTASLGELAEDFTWQKLCILADSDMQGRIASDVEECREKTALCRILAEEAGCLYGSFPWSDAHTKHAYLSGRNVMPDQFLYDDTWGEVILMSGLPGTGKDTWIAQHVPKLPVVSLDHIRRKRNISPAGDQGAVIREAREQAKALLREKQPFVWNATNISREIRQKQIRLFEQYGAAVRIVYLETDEAVRRKRNASRADAVPEAAVEKMLQKTEPPLPEEARSVEWLSV